MGAVRIVPLLVLAPLASAPGAQSVRLNGALAQPGAGDVTDFAFSRSGARVIFRADQATDEVFELFSGPRDGSAPAERLHAPLAGGRDVLLFAAAAGERVVFVADLDTDELFELWSAPLDASAAPTRLSGLLVAGGDVLDFQLTPDGAHAVFQADGLVDGVAELFSVPIDGSAAALRLDPLGRNSTLYRIGPDGSFVVFANGPGFSDERLYRVPLDASQAPVFLAHSGPIGFASYTFFEDLRLSADGQHATCTAVELYLDRGSCVEEYSTVLGLDLASATSTRLNPLDYFCYVPPVTLAGERVLLREDDGRLVSVLTDASDRRTIGTAVSEFVLTPDEAQVLFLAGSVGARSLLVAPVDGSSPAVTLAGPGTLASLRVASNSALAFYLATDPASSFRGLFAVALSGGAPLLLNGPLLANRGVLDFAPVPVGNALVYREDRNLDEVFELWSVDLALDPRQLSSTLEGFRDVASYAISPDGAWVVHLGDVRQDQTDELFGTPLDAATPLVAYNEPLLPGLVFGDVLSFQATNDGARVVYRADERSDEYFELYSTRADGRGTTRRLTELLPDDGDALADFVLTPDGEGVLFKFVRAGFTSLFACPLADGVPLELDTPGSFPGELVLSPDGTQVVCAKSGQNLRRARVDGSQPPITLADFTVGVASAVQIPASGTAALFLGTASGHSRLYRVRLDGTEPPGELGPLLVANGGVASFRITPDAGRVVLRADATVDEVFELYGTPSHGFGASMRLNGTLVSNGDVLEYALTPDSARVVYRADQTLNNTFELHSVPVNGGSALRLTVLPTGRDVEPDFRIVPASTHALYRANPTNLDSRELFRVVLDGSAPPEALLPAFAPGRDVTSFDVSPDGRWVVFVGDPRADEVFELFSRSLLGPALRALVVLPSEADVSSFRLSPDSLFAFYLADARLDGTQELYRVPLDGSAPPGRVHAPLPVTSDVEPDYLPQLGGRVLYRVDPETEGVLELFHFLALDAEHTLPAARPTVTKSLER